MARQPLALRSPQAFHLNTVVHDHSLKMSPEDPNLARVRELVSVLKNEQGGSASSKRHEKVRELVNLLTGTAVCCSLSDETLDDLVSIVTSAVLREVPELPEELLYGETFVPINVENWGDVSVYHELGVAVLKGASRDHLTRLIDCDCIRKLVDVLNSPDRNEQAAIESMVTCMFEQLPEARNTIFRHMLAVVNQYLDGVRVFVAIPSALRFFVKYFNTMSMHWNNHYNGAFRNVFVRLFGGEMLKEYYPQLAEVCSIFYTYDPCAPEFTLKFLLRHWPLTNTTKEVIYLHHLNAIVSFLKWSGHDRLVDHLFAHIRAALSSPNFKVCDAALKLVGDNNFMCYFTSYFPHIIPVLCSDVSQLANHWNDEVRAKAKAVFEILYSISQSAPPVAGVREEQSEKDVKATWVAIYKAGRAPVTDAVAPVQPRSLVGVTDHHTHLLY